MNRTAVAARSEERSRRNRRHTCPLTPPVCRAQRFQRGCCVKEGKAAAWAARSATFTAEGWRLQIVALRRWGTRWSCGRLCGTALTRPAGEPTDKGLYTSKKAAGECCLSRWRPAPRGNNEAATKYRGDGALPYRGGLGSGGCERHAAPRPPPTTVSWPSTTTNSWPWDPERYVKVAAWR
jgi:hypothetical protein